jgi:hypothetical protein
MTALLPATTTSVQMADQNDDEPDLQLVPDLASATLCMTLAFLFPVV